MKKKMYREMYYGNEEKEVKVIKTKKVAKKQTVNKKDKNTIKKIVKKRGK